MATRVTYHEEYVRRGEPFAIEHPDGAQVQVVGADETSGGANRGVLVRYLLVEPGVPCEGVRATVRPYEVP